MTQPQGAWKLDRNSGLLIPVVQTGIGIVDPRNLPAGDGAAFLELQDGDRAAESSAGSVRFRSTSAGVAQVSMNGAPWANLQTGSPTPTQKCVFFEIVEGTNNSGSYRVQQIGAVGTGRTNLFGPSDLASVVSLDLVGFNVSATPGPGADIDLVSEYGNIDAGEASNFHTTTDVASTYTLPAVNAYFTIDITGVFPLLAAGDGGGVFIDHKGIGGNLAYTSVRLCYL